MFHLFVTIRRHTGARCRIRREGSSDARVADQSAIIDLRVDRAQLRAVLPVIVLVHPFRYVVFENQRLRRVHAITRANGAVRCRPIRIIIQNRKHATLERPQAFRPALGLATNHPALVQVVQERPREQIPCRLRQNVLAEIADGVIHHAVLVQCIDARLRNAQLVIVHLAQHVEQHVLQHLLAVQVVVLDVLPLAPLETLVEGYDQQTSIHGLGAVAEPRVGVHALGHEPAETHRARLLELAVEQERVARDNRLESRRIVQIRARVVLIRNHGGYAHQGLEHELLAERLQRNGRPRIVATQVAHQGAIRALTVVTGLGIQPCGLVPGHARADGRPQHLPEELHDLGVVGQVAHPARDVPVGAVVGIMNNRVRGTLYIVHGRLAREHVRRVERHQNLVLVVEDAVVHGNQIAVLAARHTLAFGAQNADDLGDIATANRRMVSTNSLLERILRRVVNAQRIAVGLIDADVVVAVIAGVHPAHALRVVQMLDNLRDLPRNQRAKLANTHVSGSRIGIRFLNRSARRSTRVARAQIVRFDSAVRRLQKLRLHFGRGRRHIQIETEQIVIRDGLQQPVIGQIFKIFLNIKRYCAIITVLIMASIACSYRPICREWGGFLFIRHTPTPPRHRS